MKDMPPKLKKVTSVIRPSLSTSSLVHVPKDAVTGYQDRIESEIKWTLNEQASREHKRRCSENTPNVNFKEALINKLNSSICHSFLNKDTSLSLKELWELLPITLWDKEKFGDANDDACFQSHNNITDSIIAIIKKAVNNNDCNVIKTELKKTSLLRVIDCEMTHLDRSLSRYNKLTTLNLYGNCLSVIEVDYLPAGLQILELNSNRIPSISAFTKKLPKLLVYLGLGNNVLTSVGPESVSILCNISVLDLSDNDICDLDSALEELSTLPQLCSLSLAGNPCSMCSAYAIRTIEKLPQLSWLDDREVLEKDRLSLSLPLVVHIDDLKSSRFIFTVLRVMAVPQPPKTEKGVTITFHVEVELPLLDSKRRQFLMYRRQESLTEIIQSSRGDVSPSTDLSVTAKSKTDLGSKASNDSNVYNKLTTKNSNEYNNFTIFESNKVQWNKVMTFQQPTLRIFCPDLRALRNTFHTEVTTRLVCTVSYPTKPLKSKKSAQSLKPTGDQYCTLATVRCRLRNPDWTQNQQYFHWDDNMGTEYAKQCGDDDLSTYQYTQAAMKLKGKAEASDTITRRQPPDNLTCHFGFGIETIRPK